MSVDLFLDCWDMIEAVCPYCGFEHSDSAEFFSGMNDTTTGECDECGLTFKIERDYEVTYTTKPVPQLQGDQSSQIETPDEAGIPAHRGDE